MKEIYAMCCQATSMDLLNATSSQVLGAGVTHSDSLDGPTIVPCGLEAAPASLSARQAKERGLLMSGTYGLRSITSLNSKRLRHALESRLDRRLDSCGSILYSMTWKDRITPAQRLILARRASAHRILDSDCTGWQTPKTPTGGAQGFRPTLGGGVRKLEDQCLLAGWPTPTCPTNTNGHQAGNNRFTTKTVHLCSGISTTGYIVEMEKLAPLNPAHSRWLMGYPIEWENCADSATRSSHKSRRNS